ncbi:bifunctional (p)ppGpp synthetase/guanosine-3',5'-bis(diphosphate) 3'-pyrophosphohydrolase [Luteimonas sp. MC1782]|uniref:RelA/SpoT family protein n=1 Tax=Luteimonas sp. MC1782 TaxID=2760305 RepID=UPI0016019DBE|nr:bifunctional (p)ppGpp synthetase/guanosine-3',5'-bis(diphosphate) 3'-pyrophosphohydrolase [Luteimonas sp. MC1782]MBB1473831.1 bifunctional (p)ppGpp synthetase/guanosine-3',5'-bis(diphosphate) 3'-pyrophosphohydrolase [Luteimonas sp. MC1782]
MAEAVDIETLLAWPALGTLAEPLCALLRDAAEAGPCAGGEPPQVLADTLDALALLDADGEVLVAAVLHACPAWAQRHARADTPASPAISALLEGQHAAGQVWALHAEQERGRNHEGLRRLLLAIVRDLRVVPILLARQLVRMRAAAMLPDAERLALARLTRDIHAPLANRLGIWQLKWELEDLAFRHLEPATYRQIATLLDDKRAGRERYIEDVKARLGEALAVAGIAADIAGRPKHIYSIWKKMQKKNAPIGELYDLRAVRVLVDDVQACYAALGAVHALWAPVPGEFDDYIARPKHNDYRSLHTAVVGPEGKTLEVQIRTREMHDQAELGVAAHWRYKEHAYQGRGGAQRSAAGEAAVNRKIEWMRRLLEAPAEAGDGALAGAFDTELVEDRIYALTPKGEVVDLPLGATPLDFAYRVHTEVGHRCRGAKVDGRIVTLDHVLHTGDRVEILTGKVSEPRRDWLLASNGFLASARSREKVRSWFHKLDRARNLQAGRELLDRELKRVGMQHADPTPALRRFNVDTVEDLQVLVALGDVGPHQVVRALADHEREQREAEATGEDPEVIALRAPKRLRPGGKPAFTVVGVDNLLVQVARCCQPLPGEAVAGYLTRARGVSVHRGDCASFLRLAAREPQRVLPVEWGASAGAHQAELVLQAVDRKHLLKDVTNLIAQEDAHVLAIDGDAGGARGRGRVQLRLSLRVADFGQLSRLLGKLEALPGVERAYRT